MDKILKFSSQKPSSSFKRPPKLNTQPYYSEYEDEHEYYDRCTHGPYIKIYTKKEVCHMEPMKPIYETDQEPTESISRGF